MQYFDILIFALIAIFLGLRLRSVLGSRTGEEKPPPDPFSAPQSEPGKGKIVRFPGQSAPKDVRDAEFEEAPAKPVEVPDFTAYGAAALGLEAIHKADSGFTPKAFQEGAKAAFEMIVAAFAKGDAKSLKPLLAPHVFKDFASAIETRQQEGQVMVSELVAISDAAFEAARMDGSQAFVTLRFVSEQVSALKDKEGKVIEGDPLRVDRAVDIWTFSRDTRSRDPNWILVETLTPE
ncbi:MAG: Tim44 domain-containing protein [Alphaproteobacteria bacterium]|nr:Tim44 domain-containing protein [Alphaproteobacteria bacterium]